jgi:hypothetical protein
MAIVHAKVSTVADGGDTDVVQPSDWNANHTIEDASILVAHLSAAAIALFDVAGAAAAAVAAHEVSFDHTKLHTRSHSITGTSDHTSTATAGQLLKADANGLPVDATNTDAAVASAVTASHARAHAITSTSDHTSSATSGKMLKADANGLPVDATNTDTDVADAVTKKHTRAHAVLDSSDHSDTLTGTLVAGDILFVNSTPKLTRLAKGSDGDALLLASGLPAWTTPSANAKIRSLTFIIDGGGSAITTGIKGDLEIPFACTITRVTMLADQSGSIVVDIWKDSYANVAPTVADTITASAKPTITTAIKSQDATLTGWTTSISAGDVLRFNVDSITSITRVTISIRVTET